MLLIKKTFLLFSVTLLTAASLLANNNDRKDTSSTIGVASYYHKKFNGRKTSSGEIFSNDSLTAAHKTLPLGSWVKVTNLKNDSSIIVKINDRLPKTSKRSIDLSQKAAKKLNFIKSGLTKVKIEKISSSNP